VSTAPRQGVLPSIGRGLEACIEQACRIIQTATDVYRPSTRYAMFSGGMDSLVTTHLCMEQFDFDAVVFIDTGTGAPQTKEYVHRLCDYNGWPLKTYAADEYVRGDGTPDPQIYEELVVPPEVRRGELTWLERGGFPGPTETGHGKMFDRLKGRPIGQAVREAKSPHQREPRRPPEEWAWRRFMPTDHETTADDIYESEASNFNGVERSKTYDRVMMVTGVYADESGRRFQLKGKSTPINRDGAQLWANPCFHWKKRHMAEYREQAEFGWENPIYEYELGSLECNCGAFAKDGELRELGRACPMIAKRIQELDELSDEYGYFWGYEEGPPASVVEAKKELRDEDDDDQLDLARGNICNDCGFFGSENGQERARQFQKVWELKADVDVADRINEAMQKIRERKAS